MELDVQADPFDALTGDKAAFIAALRDGPSPNVSAACRAVGWSRAWAYIQRQPEKPPGTPNPYYDPIFDRAWGEAEEASVDNVAGAVYGRALTTSPSEALRILENRRPAEWAKAPAQVQVSGQVDHAHLVIPGPLVPQLVRLAAQQHALPTGQVDIVGEYTEQAADGAQDGVGRVSEDMGE